MKYIRRTSNALGARRTGDRANRRRVREATAPWRLGAATRSAGLATLLAVIVTGCGTSDLSDLEDLVEEAAKSSGEDLPAPAAQEAIRVTYGAVSERSPFEPFAEIRGTNSLAAPDPARPRQPPEFFPLGQLEMVGTLAVRETVLALIRDPNGTTHPLGVGDFLGRDHGRVTNVYESRIDILELVEDGHGGWAVRPRTLGLTVPDGTVEVPTESETNQRNGGRQQ